MLLLRLASVFFYLLHWLIDKVVFLNEPVVQIEHKAHRVHLRLEVAQVAHCKWEGLVSANLAVLARMVVENLEEALVQLLELPIALVNLQTHITAEGLRKVSQLAFKSVWEAFRLLLARLAQGVDVVEQLLVDTAQNAVDQLASFHHVEDDLTEDGLIVDLPVDFEQKLPFCLVFVNVRKSRHILSVEPQHKGFLLQVVFFFEVRDLDVLGLCLVFQRKNCFQSFQMT